MLVCPYLVPPTLPRIVKSHYAITHTITPVITHALTHAPATTACASPCNTTLCIHAHAPAHAHAHPHPRPRPRTPMRVQKQTRHTPVRPACVSPSTSSIVPSVVRSPRFCFSGFPRETTHDGANHQHIRPGNKEQRSRTAWQCRDKGEVLCVRVGVCIFVRCAVRVCDHTYVGCKLCLHTHTCASPLHTQGHRARMPSQRAPNPHTARAACRKRPFPLPPRTSTSTQTGHQESACGA